MKDGKMKTKTIILHKVNHREVIQNTMSKIVMTIVIMILITIIVGTWEEGVKI